MTPRWRSPLPPTWRTPAPARSTTDALATADDLDALVREWSYTGSRGDRRQELADVRALREEIARLWIAGDADVVAEGVNRLLAEGGAMPQLVRHDGWDWHLHATDPGQPLGTRMAVEAAMALLDVVRAGELARLKTCDAEDCDDLHVDLSRNRSRRYCGTRCGNRADAAAYRARKPPRPDAPRPDAPRPDATGTFCRIERRKVPWWRPGSDRRCRCAGQAATACRGADGRCGGTPDRGAQARRQPSARTASRSSRRRCPKPDSHQPLTRAPPVRARRPTPRPRTGPAPSGRTVQA